jgi:hypothetical protein
LLHFEGGNKVESIILTPSNFSDNGEYIINNSYITKNSIQEIFLAGDVTLEQYFAFNDSCLIGTVQDNGYCVIKALGQIPEIDIPVTILIRGV